MLQKEKIEKFQAPKSSTRFFFRIEEKEEEEDHATLLHFLKNLQKDQKETRLKPPHYHRCLQSACAVRSEQSSDKAAES